MGWSPKHNFEKGIEKTIKWYIENKRWIENIKSGEYQNWIKKHYGVDSKVIYPPVKTKFFIPANNPRENYYLLVSRLVCYKKADLAVTAFNELGYPLKIVGVGPELKKLKKIAYKNIEFLGYKADEELRNLYQNCKALIFPGEEEFGIVPVEAQACGRPVIAFGKGGLLETVIENETAILFKKQTVKSLIDAINRFQNIKFDPARIRENSLKFNEEIFKDNVKAFIESKYNEFLQKNR